MKKVSKSTQARVHDYLYDEVFTIASEKDFLKYESFARNARSKNTICPIFEAMFSDNPNYPRNRIMSRDDGPPKYIDRSWRKSYTYRTASSCNVLGSDRVKFFKSSISKPPSKFNYEPEIIQNVKNIKKKCHNKSTQTLYRESSTQTIPWKPDAIGDEDCELLKLNFLQECLPVGMHEIEIIKRARKKREWEKYIIECMEERDMKKLRNIVEALYADEWAFREQEILDIQNLRYILLENMIAEYYDDDFKRYNRKIKQCTENITKEATYKIDKLQFKKEREMRQLYKTYVLKNKNLEQNIIEKYNKASLKHKIPRELYLTKLERAEYYEDEEDQEKQLQEFQQLIEKAIEKERVPEFEVKPLSVYHGTRICLKVAKWSEQLLNKFYEKSSLFGESETQIYQCSLLKRIYREEFKDETKYYNLPHENFEAHDAAVLLQNVVRGRAIQSLLFEGRNRCRELIKELQTTHVLLSTDDKMKEHIKVLERQREHAENKLKTEHLRAVLKELQGTVEGTLLDFLNKELIRLMDERKAHAVVLLAERERRKKEAAEAGKRQAEENRRQELDEMFKQVVKVHQDTVDLYLRDVIIEGIDNMSSQQADQYVKSLTHSLQEHKKDEKKFDKEEFIAYMVHDNLIPQVEQDRNIEHIKKYQKMYLLAAHEEIYKNVDSLEKKYPENE